MINVKIKNIRNKMYVYYVLQNNNTLFLGLGFVILDNCNNPHTSKNNRLMLLGLGFSAVIISYMVTRMFMHMKLPSYLG